METMLEKLSRKKPQLAPKKFITKKKADPYTQHNGNQFQKFYKRNMIFKLYFIN